jgi:hypothetical protein
MPCSVCGLSLRERIDRQKECENISVVLAARAFGLQRSFQLGGFAGIRAANFQFARAIRRRPLGRTNVKTLDLFQIDLSELFPVLLSLNCTLREIFERFKSREGEWPRSRWVQDLMRVDVPSLHALFKKGWAALEWF